MSKTELDVKPRLVTAVRVGLIFEESCTDALENTFGWVGVFQNLLPILLVDTQRRFEFLGQPAEPGAPAASKIIAAKLALTAAPDAAPDD